MTIDTLLDYLRDLVVELCAERDRLCYAAPRGRLTPTLREELRG